MTVTDRTKKIIENIAKREYADRVESAVYKLYNVPEAKERKVARLSKKIASTADFSGVWERMEEFLAGLCEEVKFDKSDIAHFLLGDRMQYNGYNGNGDPIYYFEEDPNSEATAEDAYVIAVEELGLPMK